MAISISRQVSSLYQVILYQVGLLVFIIIIIIIVHPEYGLLTRFDVCWWGCIRGYWNECM